MITMCNTKPRYIGTLEVMQQTHLPQCVRGTCERKEKRKDRRQELKDSVYLRQKFSVKKSSVNVIHGLSGRNRINLCNFVVIQSC